MTLNSVPCPRRSIWPLTLSFSEYFLNKNANTYQVVLQNSACGHPLCDVLGNILGPVT